MEGIEEIAMGIHDGGDSDPGESKPSKLTNDRFSWDESCFSVVVFTYYESVLVSLKSYSMTVLLFL